MYRRRFSRKRVFLETGWAAAVSPTPTLGVWSLGTNPCRAGGGKETSRLGQDRPLPSHCIDRGIEKTLL